MLQYFTAEFSTIDSLIAFNPFKYVHIICFVQNPRIMFGWSFKVSPLHRYTWRKIWLGTRQIRSTRHFGIWLGSGISKRCLRYGAGNALRSSRASAWRPRRGLLLLQKQWFWEVSTYLVLNLIMDLQTTCSWRCKYRFVVVMLIPLQRCPKKSQSWFSGRGLVCKKQNVGTEGKNTEKWTWNIWWVCNTCILCFYFQQIYVGFMCESRNA